MAPSSGSQADISPRDISRRFNTLLSQGAGIADIARATGLKRQTIYRIKQRPEQQAAALAAWYPDLAA